MLSMVSQVFLQGGILAKVLPLLSSTIWKSTADADAKITISNILNIEYSSLWFLSRSQIPTTNNDSGVQSNKICPTYDAIRATKVRGPVSLEQELVIWVWCCRLHRTFFWPKVPRSFLPRVHSLAFHSSNVHLLKEKCKEILSQVSYKICVLTEGFCLEGSLVQLCVWEKKKAKTCYNYSSMSKTCNSYVKLPPRHLPLHSYFRSEK